MKTLLALSALLTSILVASAAANPVHLEFTSPDGTEWRINNITGDPSGPCCPYYLGQSSAYVGVYGIGSRTNYYYNGTVTNAYHIDVPKNELILGDSWDVGILYANTGMVDVGTYHGFCIDNYGIGWLATQYNDGDPSYFLYEVDLATAHCTLIDRIGVFPNFITVNGMVALYH